MSNIPEKVKEIADAIKRENPSIDDETKFRIAWATYKKMQNESVELNEVANYVEAGFDLTDIEPKFWLRILRDLKITPNPEYKNGCWVWWGKNIRIHTGANPLTGQREPSDLANPSELGYASYIGIYGDEDKVRYVFNTIKKFGHYKDYSEDESMFI